MRIRASCVLDLHLEVDTPLILKLRPKSGASQWIYREEYTFSHRVNVTEYQDTFGNLCQRLVAPAGEFRVFTVAEVETADTMDQEPGAPFVEVNQLPADVLDYLLPSRYCESDRLGDFTFQLVGETPMGYDQVALIHRWLRDNIPYYPGSSVIPLSAVEVQQQGFGVCRDLAHLGIAMCRSISIPARLVVGYLHGLTPMDLHAWFEAYIGFRWYAFDPTQTSLTGGRIAIAYGRDAADVSILHQFGPLPLFSDMKVTVAALKDQVRGDTERQMFKR